MSKDQKTVRVTRKGRSVEIDRAVYEYNRRKRAERAAFNKVDNKSIKK